MKFDLVKFVSDLAADPAGQALLEKHGFVAQPHVSVEQIIAILKVVCEGASVVCPVIQSLP